MFLTQEFMEIVPFPTTVHNLAPKGADILFALRTS
jgi:hypothetical protein